MNGRVEILWLSESLASADRCVISDSTGSATITGTAVLALGDIPAAITYDISTNSDWSTRAVEVQVEAGAASRSLRISHGDRGWLLDGIERPDLAGCTGLDLGWSPATNTLPLRAAPLAVGESASSTAAWLRFPELDVVPSTQTYTRLGADRVRYQSATFTAELVVTSDDVVTRYGDGLWRAARVHRRID